MLLLPLHPMCDMTIMRWKRKKEHATFRCRFYCVQFLAIRCRHMLWPARINKCSFSADELLDWMKCFINCVKTSESIQPESVHAKSSRWCIDFQTIRHAPTLLDDRKFPLLSGNIPQYALALVFVRRSALVVDTHSCHFPLKIKIPFTFNIVHFKIPRTENYRKPFDGSLHFPNLE